MNFSSDREKQVFCGLFILNLAVLVYLSSIASLFTITGESSVYAGDSVDYLISVNLDSVPDSDWTDLHYSDYWFNWALLDLDQNIKDSGDWVQLDSGDYSVSASFTAPSSAGDYVLISTVVKHQYDYSKNKNKWLMTSDILFKEAKKIQVKSVGKPSSTSPSWSDFLSNIWAWILGLFGVN